MHQKKYRTKSDMVCCLVREDIIKGILRPGTRLIISNVAKQYDVSEIPVREAFQNLIQDGFIAPLPNAGFVVSALSKTDVREIFEIRVVLESLAARQAVQYISNSDIDRLEEIVEQAKEYLRTLDFDQYWKINRQFHHSIYKFCGNERLYNTIIDLYSLSTRYPSYYTKPEELEKSIREHYVILDAYRRRDADLVEKLTRSHTIDTYQHVLQRLDEETEKQKLTLE